MGRVMPEAGIDAEGVRRWLHAYGTIVSERAAELSRLDAAIGDGDHGTNMDRGFKAVRERVLAVAAGKTIDQLCKETGMTLLSTVGGAAGPLYGTFFLRIATAAGSAPELEAQQLEAALRAGVEGVRQRGKAEPGDKTMLDALQPAVDALRGGLAEGQALPAALAAAAAAAEEGCKATIPLLARKGRASYLGERSRDHQDPGATSSAYLIRALAGAVAPP
jgi:phosphoenolpyruvate---glycerone phosphotransferase subunit DhaL